MMGQPSWHLDTETAWRHCCLQHPCVDALVHPASLFAARSGDHDHPVPTLCLGDGSLAYLLLGKQTVH